MIDHATRPLSRDEHETIDGDEHLPFGHFAPTAVQAALIRLAANSFLHRGLFRRTMTGLVMGMGGKPLDVTFRGCAYRVRGRNNLIEFGLLLNPGYNDADIDFLIEGMPTGGVFIDIGANIGLYALPLAKAAGPTGTVVAIDANRLMARRLAFNAAASDIGNVAIFACAVSDYEGTGSLNIRKDDIAIVALEEGADGSVPVRTLPSILAEAGVRHIDALKIDIEGHEERVLAPFIRTCDAARLPRRIVIERPTYDDDYPACAAAFRERGYRLKGRSRNNSFYSLG
jgi:FkbM family methyltransferase